MTIAAKNVNGAVQITFSDTGDGISQENLEKIFDPLFKTKVKGPGLGLAISSGRNVGQSTGTTFDARIPEYC